MEGREGMISFLAELGLASIGLYVLFAIILPVVFIVAFWGIVGVCAAVGSLFNGRP